MRHIKSLKSGRKAQTILEYLMMLAIFVVPTALVISDLLSDSGPNTRDNIVRVTTKDALGEENRFGVIGAPYP